MLRNLLITLHLLALPSIGLACSPALKPWKSDPSIRVAADCSFTEAGTPLTEMYGGAAVDLKNGRIGQKLSELPVACALPVSESLLVADCTSKDTIVISGQPSDELRAKNAHVTDRWYGVENKARNLYPPHGAIRLTPTTTVAELEQVAEAEGYSHQRNIRFWAGNKKKKNRFNVFCGCKIYYPDSRGAALE